MPVEHLAPPCISDRGGEFGGADDIGEQHGGEHPVDLRGAIAACDELVHDIPGRHVPVDVDTAQCGRLVQDRTGNLFGQHRVCLEGQHVILRMVDHEGGDGECWQHGPDIDTAIHLHDLADHAWAGRGPLVARHDRHGRLVVGQAGEVADDAPVAPMLIDRVEELLVDLVRGAPRVVRRRCGSGERGVQDKTIDALRVSGGEQDCQRPSPRTPDQRGPLHPRSVHHSPDVIHAILGRAKTEIAVRATRTPLVERHEAAHLRQPFTHGPKRRDVPLQITMTDQPIDQHDVGRAVRHHLIGDVQPARAHIPSPQHPARR